MIKTLLTGLVLAGLAGVMTGCATPAYTGGPPTIQFPVERATGENANRIVRNWSYESRQAVDDFNSIFLLDPASRLTRWNVR